MPTQRLSMRRIKQLLTMHVGAGASTRAIGRELGIAPSTVREYLGRATAAGIGWPLAADSDDPGQRFRLKPDADSDPRRTVIPMIPSKVVVDVVVGSGKRLSVKHDR
jgi:hypothetical protein